MLPTPQNLAAGLGGRPGLISTGGKGCLMQTFPRASQPVLSTQPVKPTADVAAAAVQGSPLDPSLNRLNNTLVAGSAHATDVPASRPEAYAPAIANPTAAAAPDPQSMATQPTYVAPRGLAKSTQRESNVEQDTPVSESAADAPSSITASMGSAAPLPAIVWPWDRCDMPISTSGPASSTAVSLPCEATCHNRAMPAEKESAAAVPTHTEEDPPDIVQEMVRRVCSPSPS